jgi:hypothetical protein
MNDLDIQALNGQNRSEFSCGHASLDNWLKNTATKAHKNGIARVYVGMAKDEVVGYYSLSAATILPSQYPVSIKGLDSRFPIPAILLGRWAVNKSNQGNGFGGKLLIDAVKKTIAAADIIGASLLVVDPIDEEAKQLYIDRLEFKELKDTGGRLYLPMKSVRDLAEQ